MAAVR